MVKYLDIKSAGKILDIVKKYFVRNKEFEELENSFDNISNSVFSKQDKLKIVKTSETKSNIKVLEPNTYYIVDDDKYIVDAVISSSVLPEDEILIQVKGSSTVIITGKNIKWEHEPLFNRTCIYLITVKDGFASYKEFRNEKVKLPADYQRVEWIMPKVNFEDGVYIDTDFVFNEDAYDFKIEFSTAGYANGYLYGISDKNEMYEGEDFYGSEEEDTYENNTGSPGGHFYHIYLDRESVEPEIVHTIESVGLYSDNGKVKLDGEVINYRDETSFRIPMFLFSLNNGTGFNYTTSIRFRIHRYTVYDKNKNPVVDMIPCYTKYRHEVGMYDIIRERMFYNSLNTSDYEQKFKAFDYGKEVY